MEIDRHWLDVPKTRGVEHTRYWFSLFAKAVRAIQAGWRHRRIVAQCRLKYCWQYYTAGSLMSCVAANERKTNSHKPTTSLQTGGITRKWSVCTCNRSGELIRGNAHIRAASGTTSTQHGGVRRDKQQGTATSTAAAAGHSERHSLSSRHRRCMSCKLAVSDEAGEASQ